MKTLGLFFGICVALYADFSVKQIEDMVRKIDEKRQGVKLDTLESTKDPFIRLKQENNTTIVATFDQKEEQLSLHAILNGKAFINDTWLSPNEMILGYTLKYVGDKGVVLRNGNQIKKLLLREKNTTLIQVEER
jgi:frataxin-like iron-binding protein CyaY